MQGFQSGREHHAGEESIGYISLVDSSYQYVLHLVRPMDQETLPSLPTAYLHQDEVVRCDFAGIGRYTPMILRFGAVDG